MHRSVFSDGAQLPHHGYTIFIVRDLHLFRIHAMRTKIASLLDHRLKKHLTLTPADREIAVFFRIIFSMAGGPCAAAELYVILPYSQMCPYPIHSPELQSQDTDSIRAHSPNGVGGTESIRIVVVQYGQHHSASSSRSGSSPTHSPSGHMPQGPSQCLSPV